MKGTSAAEGVAVDAMGSVYGGEVGPRQLAKHFPDDETPRPTGLWQHRMQH
jgi:hypothetical protein